MLLAESGTITSGNIDGNLSTEDRPDCCAVSPLSMLQGGYDRQTTQGTAENCADSELSYDMAELKHIPLLPRLEGMFNTPSLYASLILNLDRDGSDNGAPTRSTDMGPKIAEEFLQSCDPELYYDMPELEDPGRFEENDDIYGDMPDLETADCDIAIYNGIQSLLRCSPGCQLCMEPVQLNGVIVLDRHFRWIRRSFESSVHILILLLLLAKFGISKPALYGLFRFIFHVHLVQTGDNHV